MHAFILLFGLIAERPTHKLTAIRSAP